ncbi:hypothetical protein D3C79_931740 [compost metagenome]
MQAGDLVLTLALAVFPQVVELQLQRAGADLGLPGRIVQQLGLGSRAGLVDIGSSPIGCHGRVTTPEGHVGPSRLTCRLHHIKGAIERSVQGALRPLTPGDGGQVNFFEKLPSQGLTVQMFDEDIKDLP